MSGEIIAGGGVHWCYTWKLQKWSKVSWKPPFPISFVQFYLGTWLHRRGVYPSHMEGQWSHAAALSRCILVNEGQAI